MKRSIIVLAQGNLSAELRRADAPSRSLNNAALRRSEAGKIFGDGRPAIEKTESIQMNRSAIILSRAGMPYAKFRMTKVLFFLLAAFSVFPVVAQELDGNQNPRHAASRDRYLKLADSINRGQSTTSQDTYKAIDYLADKQEARDARKEYRRDLRMERARRGYYDDYYNYSPYYRNYGTQFYHPYFYRWNGSRGWRAIGYPFY